LPLDVLLSTWKSEVEGKLGFNSLRASNLGRSSVALSSSSCTASPRMNFFSNANLKTYATSHPPRMNYPNPILQVISLKTFNLHLFQLNNGALGALDKGVGSKLKVNELFKSVGLVVRYDKKKALKLADDLAEHLQRKGLEVYVEDTLAGTMATKQKTVPIGRMKTDFIVTIGGDGTILRTCLSIPKPEPPILAINMGVRGFLAEVFPKEAIAAVDKCLAGEFKVEKCMKLAVAAEGMKFPDALNEVVVSADEPAKLLYTSMLKNGKPIINCQSDGLMVSTQTGSTGYSLSAGGPVLDPGVDAFVLTPICPLTVFHPIVFPADSALTIEVRKPERINVLIDGRNRQLISQRHQALTVTRSRNETSFVRLKESFYHRLRSRLLFRGMA